MNRNFCKSTLIADKADRYILVVRISMFICIYPDSMNDIGDEG